MPGLTPCSYGASLPCDLNQRGLFFGAIWAAWGRSLWVSRGHFRLIELLRKLPERDSAGQETGSSPSARLRVRASPPEPVCDFSQYFHEISRVEPAACAASLSEIRSQWQR